MLHQLSLDRFEGEAKQTAVLVTDDGRQIDFPRALLPEDARAGDILAFTIRRDPDATKALADQTQSVEKELETTDPGGDITL